MDTNQTLILADSTSTEELTPHELIKPARGYAAASKAQSTRKAYRLDWQQFEAWCDLQMLSALPAQPETLAYYLTAMAKYGRKVAGIERALAAISQAHKAAGFASPRSSAPVQAVMRGIKRTHGTSQTQKSPVLVQNLRQMVSSLPDNLKGYRDSALLLLGFAGAFRRSELVALNINDLSFDNNGLTVTIRRSKTDQEGAGRKVGIPFGSDKATCPVRAVKAWLEISNINTGAIFIGVNRHGKLTGKRLYGNDVARIVKKCARAAGLDASKFSGHSLRAGLATAAAKAGKSERAIMAQTGHRSVMMVRRYIRDADLFGENAASGIGL